MSNPSPLHARLPVARVLPQAVGERGVALHQVDSGDDGGDDGGRLRGAEEEGAGALGQPIDQPRAARDVAAHDAYGLGERAELDVELLVDAEVVRRAAPAAENARAVRVVHHDGRIVLLGQIDDSGQRRDIAVHAEDAVRDDQPLLDSQTHRTLEAVLQRVQVLVLVDRPLLGGQTGQAAAVDDAGVVQLVRDDGVVFAL